MHYMCNLRNSAPSEPDLDQILLKDGKFKNKSKMWSDIFSNSF